MVTVVDRLPEDTQRYARLRRRPAVDPDGFADGGWWPRSLDLARELRPLLRDLRAEGFAVGRVVYHADAWEPEPDALSASSRPIRLDRADGGSRPVVRLFDALDARRIDLVVVPPGTDRRVAERILALAAAGADIGRVSGILERELDREMAGSPSQAVEANGAREDRPGLSGRGR